MSKADGQYERAGADDQHSRWRLLTQAGRFALDIAAVMVQNEVLKAEKQW